MQTLRFRRVQLAISSSLANRCGLWTRRLLLKNSRAHRQHDRSSTASSNPHTFPNATNCRFALPQNPSAPRPRSPPIIHSLLLHKHLPGFQYFRQIFRKDVLIFTTTDQDQLKHPRRLNDTSNFHLRPRILDNRSRRKAKEHGSGKENIGIHKGSEYDTGICCRIFHVGCQDQRRERGDSRMGIVGACGQCAADYQLGVCESLAPENDSCGGTQRADRSGFTSAHLPTTMASYLFSMLCRHHC